MFDIGDLTIFPLLVKCEKEGSTHGEIMVYLSSHKDTVFTFDELVDHCTKNKYVVQTALEEFIDAEIIEEAEGGYKSTGLIAFE